VYRDDREAMAQQLETLRRDADQLREENEAMRRQLLAPRSAPTLANVYTTDPALLSDGERAALSHHGLRTFRPWVVVVLHLVTFGLFSLCYFGALHERLPKAAPDDPTAARAIGFMFIPYFNFYWVFFHLLRLTDRINLQLRIRGLPPTVPRGLMIALGVTLVIPYVNLAIGGPILGSIAAWRMQRAINQLVASA
jgi:hypothetical protein